MFPRKELSKKELQNLVRALAWNDAFGCYTRAGFEKLIWPAIAKDARWIVYFDLDNIHELNAKYGGYEVVDGMIKEVFHTLRLTDYVAGQLKSGDEFLICITEQPRAAIGDPRRMIDPEAMVNRLTDALRKVGLTATFAIVPVTSKDLLTSVKPAIDQVYAIKNSRGQRNRRSIT